MVLTSLMSGNKLKMNRKPKGMRMIDIDEIVPNENNSFDINGIEELKNSKLQYGLRKPIDVYKDEVRCLYKIIDGERRYTALKELVEADKIEPEISCIEYEVPSNSINERLQLILANATRIMSKTEKVKIVEELLEIYEQLDPKPSGKKRDWIAPFIGAKSGRTAQEYINIVERKNKESSELNADSNETESKVKNEYDLVELFKDFNRLIKTIEKINNKANKANLLDIKIAEDEKNNDVSVDTAIINIKRVITKFNYCIQTAIDIKQEKNEVQTTIGEYLN